MSTPQQAQTAGYFPSLDTMRAVGALAVLTTHTAFWSGGYAASGLVGPLLSRLDVGVAIFFVLSGFLLSRPWFVRAEKVSEGPSVGAYVWHRFLRIFPLYVLTVVIAYVAIPENHAASWAERITTIGLLNTIMDTPLPNGLGHMWSLAVEVEFYLVLPLLMWAVLGRSPRLRPRRVHLALTVLVLVWVAWYVMLAQTAWISASRQWLPAYLAWFVIGIAFAHLHTTSAADARRLGLLGRSVVQLGRLPGSCWAAALALLLISATPVAGPTFLGVPTAAGELATKSALYAAIAGLIVLPAVFSDGAGRFERVFAHPWLRHLGLVSYGIFCLHLPVLHIVTAVCGFELFRGHGVEIWLLTFSISLVAAEGAYRLVEKPAQRLRHWPARRRGRRKPSRPSRTPA